MKLDELREEIDQRTLIFLSVKYNLQYFEYLHSTRFDFPIIYKTYRFFIDRMKYAVGFTLIIDLCKLFGKGKDDKFSFQKLYNKAIYGYNKSELNSKLPKKEFKFLFDDFNSKDVLIIFEKIKITRDVYYAHLDSEARRKEISNIGIKGNEMRILVEIAENFLKKMELIYWNTSQTYYLSEQELGLNIFEHLNERNRYIEQYGRLN